MSSKQREALEKCDALLKRITKSAWFIEARMGLTKETMDVGNAITAALAEPVLNCEVGTAEEQVKRWQIFCDAQVCCEGCPCNKEGDISAKCFARWSQMPYKSEVAK